MAKWSTFWKRFEFGWGTWISNQIDEVRVRAPSVSPRTMALQHLFFLAFQAYLAAKHLVVYRYISSLSVPVQCLDAHYRTLPCRTSLPRPQAR